MLFSNLVLLEFIYSLQIQFCLSHVSHEFLVFFFRFCILCAVFVCLVYLFVTYLFICIFRWNFTFLDSERMDESVLPHRVYFPKFHCRHRPFSLPGSLQQLVLPGSVVSFHSYFLFWIKSEDVNSGNFSFWLYFFLRLHRMLNILKGSRQMLLCTFHFQFSNTSLC